MKNNNLKKIKISEKWKKIVSREYGVQHAQFSLRALSPESKFIIPKPFYKQVYVPEDKNEVCYMGEKELNELVQALKKKYFEKSENYEQFEKCFIEAGNEYVRTSMQISKTNLDKKSKGELGKIYLNYQKKNLKYTPFIWVQFIINDLFARLATEIITEKFSEETENINEIVGIILAPSKKASPVRLIEIAIGWKKLSLMDKEKVFKKFQWLPCMDIHNNPWTKEEFFSYINEFTNSTPKNVLSYRELLKKFNFTKEEKNIIKISKRLAYLKDLKDDYRRQGTFFSHSLFDEIAHRTGGSAADISYLLQEEIESLLSENKKLSKELVNERKKGFAIFYNSARKIVCQSGNEIDSVVKKFGLEHKETIVEQIKGMSASVGLAEGKVVIVKSVSDLSKVKKGDIMVAITTHPDYVLAMQKASAIITDEGGITCHAAIVSRELKKPCIVGTKIATATLDDGDLVKLDAEKGVVEILGRK